MLAAKLPIQFQDGHLMIHGSEIQKRMNGTAKEGEPIKSDKWYRLDVQNQVNHYRRIKKIYKRMNSAGVTQYINEVLKLTADSVRQHHNVIASMPQQPMSI